MKKPNALMIAFGKPHGKPDGDEPDGDEGSEEGPSEQEVAAAGELKSALKGGSDEELAVALKNFIKECEGEY